MTDYIYTTILPQKFLAKSDNVFDERNLQKNKEQITFFEKELVIIKGKGFIVVDFGKEYFGLLKLMFCKINSPNYSATIRIRLGESAAECSAEFGYKGAGNYHGVRDMSVNVYANLFQDRKK